MSDNSNPIILPDTNTGNGARFIKWFSYSNGSTVPLYEVDNFAAFNQIIGYAKFLNRDYGSVYYRGVNGLYDNVLPSIMRNRRRGIAQDITDLINNIGGNSYFRGALHLQNTLKPKNIEDRETFRKNKLIKQYNKYRIEGLLQHYAGFTRFIDLVDNHWIALWMGLHSFKVCGEKGQFIKCVRRSIAPIEAIQEYCKSFSTDTGTWELPDSFFEYILLMAFPEGAENDRKVTIPKDGVYETDNLVLVDLRKALPSVFLRPHAQHALVMRRKEKGEASYLASYYDLASQVVGIIRVRTDIAGEWLGSGGLVTKENLFPSPAEDSGYNNLLKNKIFQNPFEIKKYF